MIMRDSRRRKTCQGLGGGLEGERGGESDLLKDRSQDKKGKMQAMPF